tara:strand:+ start:95560 stop:95826 length:267 start_codon:yes stop_codon:yes gene_type:complete
MDLQQIEQEALHLSKDERARLVKQLILSLDSPSKEEVRKAWLQEAARRAEEIDDELLSATAGSAVLSKARDMVGCDSGCPVAGWNSPG